MSIIKSESLLQINAGKLPLIKSHHTIEPQASEHSLHMSPKLTYPHYRSQSEIKSSAKPYKVTISEMCNNGNGKAQFKSSTADYNLPDSRAFTYKRDRYQTQWKNNKSEKQTYIDKIFLDSKKPERVAPASNVYTPNYSSDYPSTVSQKMSKAKRTSNIDEIFKKEKLRPAPNSYNAAEALKDKVTGVYLGQNKAPRDGLVGEIVFLSQQTPCSNAYTINYDPLSSVQRIPHANLKRDITLRSPPPKTEAKNSPSPHHYPEKEKAWLQTTYQQRIPQFTISKDKTRYMDQVIKDGKKSPAVGTYKEIEITNFNQLSRGPQPHYKRGR